MPSNDEKNLAQVIDKIASMDEPARSLVQRVHEVILAAAPELKPRIWYGMPAYARSASTPALLSLRNDISHSPRRCRCAPPGAPTGH